MMFFGGYNDSLPYVSSKILLEKEVFVSNIWLLYFNVDTVAEKLSNVFARLFFQLKIVDDRQCLRRLQNYPGSEMPSRSFFNKFDGVASRINSSLSSWYCL